LSFAKWFATPEPKVKPLVEKRADPRISVQAQVDVSDGPLPSVSETKQADLINFASGGLSLRVDLPLEVGQIVWIQARVTHATREGTATAAGICWETSPRPAPRAEAPPEGQAP
jgi:hypothetical protein